MQRAQSQQIHNTPFTSVGIAFTKVHHKTYVKVMLYALVDWF